ncbi:MAG: phospholipase A [Desulfobacteraceae bacterium]|nr:phospholipase A [Desulfobacteraceae bacterium]MDH3574598.1 phospholipase A [Desulfobacteraceae bacterium]MDH3722977.1 phospholipase A [Desulfobacteraceae bacterium]MDH3837521.1 phospholipase A [Desulfobacteraceae bacterium]MDH3874957.1 phospholipase A [Desulfobacteraceae bacterium]
MRVLIAFLILLSGPVASAGGIETVIAPPTEISQAGQSMVFAVYFHNSEYKSLQVDVPDSIMCRLSAGDETVEVKAYAIRTTSEKTMTICSGCFEKVQYTLVLPSTIEGAITMAIPDFKEAHAMFAVHSSASMKASKSNETVPNEFEALDSLYELYQPYLKNLAAYDPMYFLVGTDPKKSKFQFSFKYRLFDINSTLVKDHPWTKGFHLAYTQTSFWDLESASKPFEDTSYKPEFFFLSPNIRVPWATGFFLKGGFQHESNGRAGEYSRSTNFLYIKPIYIAYSKNTKLGIMIAPKIWTYIANEDENNPDLNDYRGYFDVEMKVGQADGFVLGSNFRWAKEGGSMELDLTYPLSQFIFKNLNLYFQVQYVNALAESLINYRDRTEAVRLGFAIVR